MPKRSKLFKTGDSFGNSEQALMLKEYWIHIYCGDALLELDKITDNSVDCIITDPPYFLDKMGDDWNKEKLEEASQKSKVIGGLPVGMKFDSKQGIALQKFYTIVSQKLYRVLKPGGFFLSFSQPRLSHRMAIAMEDANFEVRDMYAWHYSQKSQAKAFSMDHFIEKRNISDTEKERIKKKLAGRKTPQLRPTFETIVMTQKPREGGFVDNFLKWGVGLIDTKITLDGKFLNTVMMVEKPSREKYNCHLTVKPVRLIQHLIEIFTSKGQIVLDPFLGSGTTALACKKSGRKCIAIEINRDYIEIAKTRIKGEVYDKY
ncbi:MAG: site-specific DNA-methyltransferase [Elusimicrobiota bacterium]|jgi:DNA modification methylase|nr:site-specific DNA-methyltransferase [Elusimicrobiota bacterium]